MSRPNGSEKPNVRSILYQYVDTSTIHGVREVFTATSLIARILWGCFVCCCFGVCIYEMNRIYEQFQRDVNVIQMSPFKPASYPYPLVRYCPKSWINSTKLDELGIDEDTLTYALSLLPQVIIPQEKIERFNKAVITEKETRLRAYVRQKKWISELDFFTAIAMDADAAVQCLECAVPPSPTATALGVCYDLQFKDFTWDTRYYADLPCVGFTASAIEVSLFFPNNSCSKQLLRQSMTIYGHR